MVEAEQAASQTGACPFADTEEKLDEAHYFLHEMLEKYHAPAAFRYSLNAFLQALRSVTLYLQREGRSAFGDFDEWYVVAQGSMRVDPMIRRLLTGRNIVAHERQLIAKCDVQVGMFRGYVCKLAFNLP